ncbi:MAG: DHH family phosphoesterase [Planctomycetes bacterium]|nr:DHH family phosphoesterase [Planctomycetota bacterium]
MLDPTVIEGLKAALDLIRDARKICIVGHVDADGDVMGSLSAFHSRFSLRKEQVFPFLFEPIPDRYSYLDFEPHAIIFAPDDSSQREMILGCDLLIALDLCVMHRLPGWSGILHDFSGKIICIDHHPAPENSFAHLSVTTTTACATGQLLYEMFRLDGESFSRQEAMALMTAIATDTGWFKYSNTDGETFAMAEKFLKCGLEPSELFGLIYQRNKLDYVKKIGKIVSEVQSALDDRLLWVVLPASPEGESDEEELKTEDLLDIFRSVGNSRCVALFRERKNGDIRVNFRSKGAISINVVAQRYGGGGHKKAAGATLKNTPMHEAVRKVIDDLIEFLSDETID